MEQFFMIALQLLEHTPAIALSSVDFPAPFGPIIESQLPRVIEKEIASSITLRLWITFKSSTENDSDP